MIMTTTDPDWVRRQWLFCFTTTSKGQTNSCCPKTQSMAVLLYLLILFYYEYINNVGGFYIQPITLLACISSKTQYEKKTLVLSPDNQSNAFVSIYIKDNYTGNLLVFQ